MLIHHYENF